MSTERGNVLCVNERVYIVVRSAVDTVEKSLLKNVEKRLVK